MRKVKTEKKEVDFLKPVAIPEIDLDDCFGQEYDPRDKDCALCSDLTYCGLVYADRVKKEIKNTEMDSGSYMDQVDFEGVSWTKIQDKAKEYEQLGDPMSHVELVEAIMSIAKTKDDIAVSEFIKRTMPKTLTLIDGYVKTR